MNLKQFHKSQLFTVRLRPRSVIYKVILENSCCIIYVNVYVVVNFLFQLIFIFPLFWGMVMYANEFKTKEKQKLTEIKN